MSKNRDADRLAHARRLMDLGCPLDLEYFQEASYSSFRTLRIKQVGAVIGSQVFEIESLGVGCMLDLEIVNDTGRPIYLRDFELELPWIDPLFCLLPDPRLRDEESQTYRFYGTKIEFPRSIVINRFVPGSTRFPKGGLVAGLVLSRGPEAIPNRYKHGEILDVKFSVVDQYDNRHSASVSVYVDKSAQFSPKLPKKPHRRLLEVSQPGDEGKLIRAFG
jgi:hypothetical protein